MDPNHPNSAIREASRINLEKGWSLGDLSDSFLCFSTLDAADLSGICFEGSDFSNASLESANLTGANVSCASFHDANLVGANLTHADLECSDFTGADLTLADLTGANITSAKFLNVECIDACIVGCCWRGDYPPWPLPTCIVTEKVVTGAKWNPSHDYVRVIRVDIEGYLERLSKEFHEGLHIRLAEAAPSMCTLQRHFQGTDRAIETHDLLKGVLQRQSDTKLATNPPEVIPFLIEMQTHFGGTPIEEKINAMLQQARDSATLKQSIALFETFLVTMKRLEKEAQPTARAKTRARSKLEQLLVGNESLPISTGLREKIKSIV